MASRGRRGGGIRQGGTGRQGGLHGGGPADLRGLQDLPRGLSASRTEAAARCGASLPGSPSWRSSAARRSTSLTIPRGLSAAELAALPDGRRGARRDLVLGRRLRVVPRRGEGRGRRAAACSAAVGVLRTDFGDFVVPNISSDADDGIGGWCAADFANAMLRGVSPDGRHSIRPFPMPPTSACSRRTSPTCWAYLATLPAGCRQGSPATAALSLQLPTRHRALEARLPPDEPAVAIDTADPAVARGQYLVEGPGHCGECHTPRNFAGALRHGALAGRCAGARGAGARPQHHRRRGRHRRLVGVRHRLLLRDRLPAGLRIRSAARWSRCRRTWRCWRADDREAIAAYLKAVPPQDTPRP